MKKILTQLGKEFWLPFLIAILWTVFSIYADPIKTTWPSGIARFGGAFFLASWAVSQVYRVRKQQSVESGLSDIQSRLTNLVTQLEEKATEMTSVVTGGDSVCYLTGNMGTQQHPYQVDPVWVVHHGKYPLYGIHVRIVDVDRSAKLSGTIAWIERRHEYEQHASLETSIPGHAGELNVQMPFGPGDVAKNFNIFFSARNGSFTQQLRFRKINGTWLKATRVDMGKLMYEDIPEGYPRNADGEVDWQALQ